MLDVSDDCDDGFRLVQVRESNEGFKNQRHIDEASVARAVVDEYDAIVLVIRE